MRNQILLATGTSHELYVYMIDQRGHLQKKTSGRWNGGRGEGGEREGRGRGEGGEREGRGMGEGWERDGRGMGEGWEREGSGLRKIFQDKLSSVAVVFVCTWSRLHRASSLLLNSYLVVKFLL